MMRLLLIAALAPAIAAGACASLIAPKAATEAVALKGGDYALDPAHAAVIFKINHLGFSNYVGRFERFDASLVFDAAHPEAAKVEAVIDIASLDIANDEFAATLLGPDWFDAARFPQAVFRSTKVTRTGDKTGRMEGELTLHGVTAPLAFDIAFNGGARDLLRGGYVVGFSAKGALSRKAFGVDKFDGVISDDVVIEIEAEFIKR